MDLGEVWLCLFIYKVLDGGCCYDLNVSKLVIDLIGDSIGMNMLMFGYVI